MPKGKMLSKEHNPNGLVTLFRLDHLLYNNLYCDYAAFSLQQEFRDRRPDLGKVQYAAPYGSSILLAARLAEHDRTTFFGVRSERKNYGLQNYCDGEYVPGVPVVVVDDTWNSGGTLHLTAKTVVAAAKLTVAPTFLTIVKLNSFESNFKIRPYEGMESEVISLFHTSEFDHVTGKHCTVYGADCKLV